MKYYKRKVLQGRSGTMAAALETQSFGYNTRSELVSAVSDVDANYNYAYAFDHIGNRATEAIAIANSGSRMANYSTNNLNQYTGINTENTENAEEADNSVVSVSSVFNPGYDEDGNATLIQTSTGTWQISYNGENRPIRFENAATQTVVECVYDSQGRRFEKKVTVAGTLTLRERYLYRGYLQIAAFDVTSSPSGESTGEAESIPVS